MNNNYESVAELLKKKHEKQNIKPVKAPKLKKVKPKKEKTKKSKKFIVGMVALITAGAIALGSGVAVLVNYFKKKNNDVPKTPNTSISTMDIGNIGTELEFPKEETKTKYENPTGNVDVNKIVEKDGKLYKDQDSADKADKKNTSSFDNKDNKYEEKDDKIYDKDIGYEITDDKGDTKESGDLDETGIPDGYAWDDVLKKYVPEDEVGKYVYADATYYDEEGNVIIKKGEIVSKETLEEAKKHLTTTKPTKKDTTSSIINNTTSSTVNSTASSTVSNTTSSSEGKINADGTYTIFDVTYADKATFEQIALSDLETLDLYLDENGVLHIKTSEMEKQLVK